MTEQFKRHIANKLRIGDIILGKPIFDGEKFTHLELGNKKIVRVNVVGNIVDKYNAEGEKKYSFFTFDDGSGQIKLKSFGDDSDRFKTIGQGQTVVVIGVLRHWNNETYLQPEIIREQDSKYLLLRKKELEKERNESTPKVENKKEIVAIKDKILNKIKGSEDEGGIDTDKIILEFRETSTDLLEQEINKLLEEGIIFEPRPGRLRYLG